MLRSWFAATTPPQGESRAATHLARQGTTHLILQLAQSTTRRGRTFTRRVPAFPRYILAHTDSPAQLVRTPGIHGLVQASGEPARIPQSTIDELVTRTNGRGLLLSPPRTTAAPRHTPGSVVRVTAGPMSGFNGTVLSCTGQQAIVMLGALGRVTLAADLLEPATDRPGRRPRRRGPPPAERGRRHAHIVAQAIAHGAVPRPPGSHASGSAPRTLDCT